MNHLELESMDKKDRLAKLTKAYDRILKWIKKNQGVVSPSEMNIAQEALREIEELTVRVDNGYFPTLTKDIMERLNQLWKQYKV